MVMDFQTQIKESQWHLSTSQSDDRAEIFWEGRYAPTVVFMQSVLLCYEFQFVPRRISRVQTHRDRALEKDSLKKVELYSVYSTPSSASLADFTFKSITDFTVNPVSSTDLGTSYSTMVRMQWTTQFSIQQMSEVAEKCLLHLCGCEVEKRTSDFSTQVTEKEMGWSFSLSELCAFTSCERSALTAAPYLVPPNIHPLALL